MDDFSLAWIWGTGWLGGFIALVLFDIIPLPHGVLVNYFFGALVGAIGVAPMVLSTLKK